MCIRDSNGTAAWKTAHIADLSHKLRGSGFANTVHAAHSIVLWELHGKPCHLGPQCGQRHLDRQKLLRRSGNEQLGVVILRQRGETVSYTHLDVYKRQAFAGIAKAWLAQMDTPEAGHLGQSLAALCKVYPEDLSLIHI